MPVQDNTWTVFQKDWLLICLMELLDFSNFRNGLIFFFGGREWFFSLSKSIVGFHKKRRKTALQPWLPYGYQDIVKHPFSCFQEETLQHFFCQHDRRKPNQNQTKKPNPTKTINTLWKRKRNLLMLNVSWFQYNEMYFWVLRLALRHKNTSV